MGLFPVDKYEEQGVFNIIERLNIGHNPAIKVSFPTEEEMIAFTRGVALGIEYENFKEISEDEFELIEKQLHET